MIQVVELRRGVWYGGGTFSGSEGPIGTLDAEIPNLQGRDRTRGSAVMSRPNIDSIRPATAIRMGEGIIPGLICIFWSVLIPCFRESADGYVIHLFITRQ